MRTLIKIIGVLFILIMINQSLCQNSVLIDPGHGGSEKGAVRAGVNEKDINLSVANKLYNACISSGHYSDVYITRITDEKIGDGITYRWKMANNYSTTILKDAYNNDIPEDGVDAFISIHCDATGSEDALDDPTYGTTVYIGDDVAGSWEGLIDYQLNRSKKSTNFAVVALQSYLHWIDDFFYDSDYSNPQYKSLWVRKHTVDVIQKTEMPAILVEMDYLSNATARGYLQDGGYQEAGASGLWHALEWTGPVYENFVEEVVDSDFSNPIWEGDHVLVKNKTSIGNNNPAPRTITLNNGWLNITPGTYIIVDDRVSLIEGAHGDIVVDESWTRDNIFLGTGASIEDYTPSPRTVYDPGGDWPVTISGLTNQ